MLKRCDTMYLQNVNTLEMCGLEIIKISTLQQLIQNLSESDKRILEELLAKAELNLNKNLLQTQIDKLQAELDELNSGDLNTNNNFIEYCNRCNYSEDVRVGDIAKTDLRRVLEVGAISLQEVLLLQDKDYCKKVFDLNYPLLSKERFDLRGYARYYKVPVYVHGEKFFLCSHWVKSNLPYLKKWLEAHPI